MQMIKTLRNSQRDVHPSAMTLHDMLQEILEKSNAPSLIVVLNANHQRTRSCHMGLVSFRQIP